MQGWVGGCVFRLGESGTGTFTKSRVKPPLPRYSYAALWGAGASPTFRERARARVRARLLSFLPRTSLLTNWQLDHKRTSQAQLGANSHASPMLFDDGPHNR